MEYTELNDEIMADDWLIPSEEISEKKLIKQTPRYNVYKADWYGDVLVYEPISSAERKQQHQHLASRRQQNLRQKIINQDELSCRLSRLDLSGNLKSPSSSSIFSFSSHVSDSESTDSAYSSISSTPRYNTENVQSTEFEFPGTTNKLASPSLMTKHHQVDENNNVIQFESDSEIFENSIQISERKQEKQMVASGNSVKPVILNKESFNFSLCHSEELNSLKIDNLSETTESSWFELNELRLVAHENFMLFMGASMSKMDNFTEGTSLVMQMNHPKAVSLYHLLHNSNLSCISPIDRFFTYKQQRQQLGNEAKLNICQQVMNAMTYLHDKNIVHGKLTSVNIYIELNQRVKISLIDDDEKPIATPMVGEKQPHNKHTNYVEFNLPALTYLSPELISTISVVNSTNECDNTTSAHVQFDTNQLTKASDIFSYGTLLFELFEERFPFAQIQDTKTIINTLKMSILDSPMLTSSSIHWNGNIKVSANEIIYQIGSGQIECKNLKNLDKIVGSTPIEQIIRKCWSRDPLMRPQFKQLASVL